MTSEPLTGRVNSIQSMGTLDGPGVRFVVFMQGCDLRCKCCHNPDTWSLSDGTEYTPEQIVSKVLRCRSYFGSEGGITISGGEPLLQPDFCRKVFELCRREGVNTCLDTSGGIVDIRVEALLNVTDRVLLDIKYTHDELYMTNVGCSLNRPLEFLSWLNSRAIPVTIRQVIIPTLNDNAANIALLRDIAAANPCVDRIELLPFRKICQVKYDNMGLIFPFADIPEPSAAVMEQLNCLLG